MATLNQVTCATNSGNTGVPRCGLIPGQIVGMILCPPNFKIAAADQADLMTTLQNATQAARTSRIFPLWNFLSLTDNSEAPVKQTFGYGFSLVVRDGNYDLTFHYRDGGLCLHKQLRAMRNSSWAVLFVDANRVLYGTKNGGDLQAIPLVQFYPPPYKQNDGSNEADFSVEIVFKPEYLNESVGFLETADDFDIFTAVTGLLNVNIKEVTAMDNTGKVKVQVLTSCGNENLYGSFKAALSQTGAWVATNAATGAAIAIATVTANDADQSIDITVTVGDMNYPAAGGKINLSLATPSALAALASPMEGYESGSLTETTVA